MVRVATAGVRGLHVLAVTLAACAASACSEPTAPPVEPSIRLELPGALPVMSETLVRLRVVAETADEPGALQEVVVYDSSGAGNARVLYWSSAIGDRGRVELDTVVNLEAAPGRHTVFAVMRHIVDDVYRVDTASVSLNLFRRATFDFHTPVPDTVYGRSLTVRGLVREAISDWSLALVMDPGTPRERILSGPVAPWEVVRTTWIDGSTLYDFDFTDTLANGAHRVALRLTDELGVRTVERDSVVHVADARYRVRALQGLSAGAARALDVNDAGDAAGSAVDIAGATRPMFWPAGGGAVELPTPVSSRDGQATGINSAGRVSGWVSRDSIPLCVSPVVWQAYVLRQLQLPPGGCGRAVDVNDAGAVLYAQGNVTTSMANDSSARIDRDGAVTIVPHVAIPAAFNSDGNVVGARYHFTSSYLLIPGASLALSGEPVSRGAGPHASGWFTGIDDDSQAVGYRRRGGLTSVYLARPGQQSIDLTSAFGGPLIPALPVWINDAGTVLAGDSTIGYFLWAAGRTRRVALAEPGWEIVALSRMNAGGSIAGQLRKQSTGELRAVVLEPVP